MTATAAALRDARTWASLSGEYLQFLYCVLPSYKGFLAGAADEDGLASSAAIQREPEVVWRSR